MGLPTIPTRPLDLDEAPADITKPYVFKPRDGAGSWMTFLIQNQQRMGPAAIGTFSEGRRLNMPMFSRSSRDKRLCRSEWLSVWTDQRFGVLPVGEQRVVDRRSISAISEAEFRRSISSAQQEQDSKLVREDLPRRFRDLPVTSDLTCY